MVYIRQYVRCGKRSCTSCPHGPYWYGYAYDRHGKRMRSWYVGKQLPDDPAARTAQEMEACSTDTSRFDALLKKRTCTWQLAAECLGVCWPIGKAALNSKYRELAKKHHPDHGGDAAAFKHVAAAWSYLHALN